MKILWAIEDMEEALNSAKAAKGFVIYVIKGKIEKQDGLKTPD